MQQRTMYRTLPGTSPQRSRRSQTTFSAPLPPGAGAVLSDWRKLSVVIGQRPALQLDAVSRELAAAGFEVLASEKARSDRKPHALPSRGHQGFACAL